MKGVFCGASVVAVSVWFWHDNQQVPSGGESNFAVNSKSAPGVEEHEDSSQPTEREQFEASIAETHPRTPSTSTTQNERSAENGTLLPESDEEELVTGDAAYYLDKRRQDLESEPKDDSWAYYMEQTISQFLGSHTGISEFEVSYVECRTIICQIQVIGFDDSTEPTWSRIMYDFRQGLPEEYHEWGWSAYPLDGRHAIVQTIKRRDP